MQQGKLQMQYLEETYEELAKLGNKPEKDTCLVRSRNSGKIVVRKQISLSSVQVYEQLKELDNPNLAKVFAVCSDGERGIVLEEYISGETLRDKLEREKHLSPEKMRGILEPLLAVLSYIHARGIVHRDLTPDNIMISGDGVVKLIDFGIARKMKKNQRKDTVIMGTVGYASPEQFGFAQTDCRTDIYAVGVLINEMLTGVLPDKEITQERGFEQIVKTCIRLAPEKRFQNAEELARAVEHVYADKPVGELEDEKKEHLLRQTDSIIPGFRDGVPRHRVYATIGYAVLLLLTVALLTKCGWNPEALILEGIAVFGILWFPVLVIGNVAGWADKFPVFRSLHREVSLTIRILLSILMMYFAVLLENYVSYTLLGLTPPA